MTSRCVNPECRQRRLRPAYLAVAGLAVLIAAGSMRAPRAAGANARRVHPVARAGEPIIAIVSLRSQRITVYDAEGWILRAPVSSGTEGTRDTRRASSASSRKSRSITPTFMTTPSCRTCSASPGRASRSMAASCRDIRHPMAVSGCPSTSPNSLFDATPRGMRVIVAPGDVAPVEFAHPLLFQPKPGAAALAASRTAEAQEATRKAAEARLAAGTALREAARPGAGSRGGKSEAQGRGAIGGRRDQTRLRHPGGGKGAG